MLSSLSWRFVHFMWLRGHVQGFWRLVERLSPLTSLPWGHLKETTLCCFKVICMCLVWNEWYIVLTLVGNRDGFLKIDVWLETTPIIEVLFCSAAIICCWFFKLRWSTGWSKLKFFLLEVSTLLWVKGPKGFKIYKYRYYCYKVTICLTWAYNCNVTKSPVLVNQSY